MSGANEQKPLGRNAKRRQARRTAKEQQGGGDSGEGAPVRINLKASQDLKTSQPAEKTTAPPTTKDATASPGVKPQPKVKTMPDLSFALPAEIVVGDKLSLAGLGAKTVPGVALKLLQNGKPVSEVVFGAGGPQSFQITWDGTEDLLAGPGPKGNVDVNVELPIRKLACPATFNCVYGDKLDLAKLKVSAEPVSEAQPTSNLPPDGILPAGTFKAVFTVPPVPGAWRGNTGTTTITVAVAPRSIDYTPPKDALLFDDAITAEGTFAAKATAGPDKPVLVAPADGKASKVGDAFAIQIKLPENANYQDASVSFSIAVRPRPRAIECNKTPAGPIAWGTPLTADTFAARASAGPDKPVLSEPAGGVTTAPDKALKVVLTLPTREGYEDAAAVEFTIPIDRKKPVLTWNARPAVLETGAAVATALCNATIDPAALAAKIEYDPPNGTKMGKAGQRLFSASFAGDALHYPAGPVSNRLIVGTASQLAGADALSSGNINANWVNKPATGSPQGRKLKEWNDDDGSDPTKMKAQARSIMGAIKQMTREKMIAHLDGLPGVSKDAANMLWKLPNGLQIRIKMTGDEFISGAIVVMEGVTTGGFSYGQDTVAFKVTVEGEASPKGPGQLSDPPGGRRIDATDYKNGAMGMNHILIMPKPSQVIEWHLEDGTTVLRDDPSIVGTVLTAKAAGAVTYFVGRQQITERFMMPGNEQFLEARAAAAADFNATTVRRKINVSTKSPAATGGGRKG